MTGQIPLAGIKTVVHNGEIGGVVTEPEEARAFTRWQQGQFQEVERLHARARRTRLASIDLTSIERAMKGVGVNPKSCKDLKSALKMADNAVVGLTKSYGRFEAMLDVLEVPERTGRPIKERWKRMKHPPLPIFAPYASHVSRIEIFFRVAIGANLIASSRPSHQVDMAYLFYLPFCNVFVSTDKLHRTCAPLFLRPDQSFVWGSEVKADLAVINAHYSALADEVKNQGIFKFAKELPSESQGIIRELYKRHTPQMLEAPLEDKLDAIAQKRIAESVKRWESAIEVPDGPARRIDDYNSLTIKRVVSCQKGAWTQVASKAPEDTPDQS